MIPATRSNSQLNLLSNATKNDILCRRRILYGTVSLIIILLFYMEWNLLSNALSSAADDERLLLIGNDQDLISIENQRPEPLPISNKSVPDRDTGDTNANKYNGDIANNDVEQQDPQDAEDGNNEDRDNDDEQAMDKETRWYRDIERDDHIFNVTWHMLAPSDTDALLQRVSSTHCDRNHYSLSNGHDQEWHALHPNFDQINLLPLPRKFQLYAHKIIIGGARLQFESNMLEHPLMASLLQKYMPLMFDHSMDEQDILAAMAVGNDADNGPYFVDTVEMVVRDPSATAITIDTDESYELLIPWHGECHSIQLSAETVFGIMHGMETLSQLIEFDFDRNIYAVKYVGHISDAPRYKYRGLHLDTARHFYPMASIRKLLDSMQFTKLNVFHWHLVDDQSWPFPLQTYPALFINASWSSQERYSLRDIYDILQYAALRGIRVIPEFDAPSHVGAMCKVLDICMDRFCTRSSGGLLDPTKSEALPVIYNIYREILPIFSDAYIHIGHDEADYKKCFVNNPELKLFAAQNVQSGKRRTKPELGVYYYFFEKIYAFMKNTTDKRMMAWDDIWFRLRKKYELPNDIILIFWRQAWKTKIWEMIKMNYTVVMSEPFYIDLTFNDLKRRYYWDLWQVEEDKKFKAQSVFDESWRRNILGGQACIWSEKIDISVLDAKLFPDLSAIAENLWIGGEFVKFNHWTNVKQRLKWHRCLLLRRGIAGSPIEVNRTYLYNRQPPEPGSCLDQ